MLSSEESNFYPIKEFDEYLNFGKYIPHHLYLEKSADDNKFFINSTLNCLTNMKSFLEFLNIIYDNGNLSDNFYALKQNINIMFTIIKEENNNIKEENNNIKEENNYINNIKENNNIEEKKNKMIYNTNDLTKKILLKITLFKDKSNQDPRLLIDYILHLWIEKNILEQENFLDTINLNYLNIKDDSSSEDINKSFIKSYTYESKNLKIEKINFVLKNIQKCPYCKKISEFYKTFPTLHFYLTPNSEKEYTLIDCFKDYIRKENKEKEYICSQCSKKIKNSENFFIELPEQFIVLIYYENIENNYEKFFYSFEEILDFSNSDFIHKNVKLKKYFLSSFILCKFPKNEEEFFYTLCRKDKDSNFLIYNNKERKVREHGKNIKRQIKRLKNGNFDRKQSFPYVLVYTSLDN